MRRPRPYMLVLLSLAATALLITSVSRIIAFVHIFGEHAGPALTQREIEAAYNETLSGPKLRQEYVPKIIHQIFHNWKDPNDETLPADWEAIRQTCAKANPDFEYKLWTANSSREFIREHFLYFMNTYDGYRIPVQRIDALRYFLLRHYGGIYMDLDNGCSRDLTPLLYYPSWVTDGGQGTLSNNIIGSRKNHPYWIMMTESLIPWSWKYPFPYFTVHYASGQWFETAIWEKYHAQLPPHPKEEDRIYRIMNDIREGPSVFFTYGRGGSWDSWDNQLFSFIGNRFVPWVGSHILLILFTFCAIIVLLGYRRRFARRAIGYKKIGSRDREMA